MGNANGSISRTLLEIRQRVWSHGPGGDLAFAIYGVPEPRVAQLVLIAALWSLSGLKPGKMVKELT